MIVVNGEQFAVQGIVELLELLGVPQPARGVAVAVDGAVVPRSEWERFNFSEGARVEVVGATQGG